MAKTRSLHLSISPSLLDTAPNGAAVTRARRPVLLSDAQKQFLGAVNLLLAAGFALDAPGVGFTAALLFTASNAETSAIVALDGRHHGGNLDALLALLLLRLGELGWAAGFCSGGNSCSLMRKASAGSPSSIAFMNLSHVVMVFSEPNGLALSEQSEPLRRERQPTPPRLLTSLKLRQTSLRPRRRRLLIFAGVTERDAALSVVAGLHTLAQAEVKPPVLVLLFARQIHSAAEGPEQVAQRVADL